MSEQSLKRSVIKALKFDFEGCWIWKVNDRFTSGIPDLLWIYKGIHIFFELKSDKGRVSKLQQYTIDKINASGGHAFVVRDVITARTICRDLINSNERRG